MQTKTDSPDEYNAGEAALASAMVQTAREKSLYPKGESLQEAKKIKGKVCSTVESMAKIERGQICRITNNVTGSVEGLYFFKETVRSYAPGFVNKTFLKYIFITLDGSRHRFIQEQKLHEFLIQPLDESGAILPGFETEFD